MVVEAVVVLMGWTDLFPQSEALVLLVVEEVSWVALPCHPSSRLGQRISRDWSCCEAGRSNFSSGCSCVTTEVEELLSNQN
jgi:hypothetical protein